MIIHHYSPLHTNHQLHYERDDDDQALYNDD